MGVSIEIYRAEIGNFNCYKLLSRCFCISFAFFRTLLVCLHFGILLALFFLSCSDVEINPGPERSLLLKLGHLNVRSLNVVDKFEEIASIILNEDFKIFALSETWLNSLIPSELFDIPGYCSLFRRDRLDGRRAGGVGLYVSSDFVPKRRRDLETIDFELLWVEIKINSINMLCGVCYRPPGLSADMNVAFLENLQMCFDKVLSKPDTLVVLLGDFNGHYDPATPSAGSDFGCSLYRWIECNNLFQVISEPTRITPTGATLLDLVITNYPGFFVNSGTLSPPSNCDHSIVFANLSVSILKQKCYTRIVWDYKNVNTDLLNAALSNYDWDGCINDCHDVNIVYKNWFSSFLRIVKEHIPCKTVVIRPKDKPWMNSGVRKAIRKRNRLLKVHTIRNSSSSWENYRSQRNFTTALIRSSKRQYYANLNNKLQDPDTNSKKWWGIVKSLYGQKMFTTVPTLVEGPLMIHDAKDKAELLNEFFCSQSRLDESSSFVPAVPDCIPTSRILSNVVTSEWEITALLGSVNINKACGPDGISNKLIKICADGITKVFTDFVNLSLRSGVFPDDWKQANVTPIFKKDDRQLKSNYRPVSLLNAFSKIIEKVVFTRVYNFLLDINFLNPLQSGFRPGDSTVNQLVYMVHKIYDAFERGKEVRMVYLDISKAFDRVWHKGLLLKLKTIGIRDPLLGWLTSYLSQRKQRVVIDGQSSNWSTVSAGVPQGSVLGPLLFLIYINDVTENLKSDCLLYADDTSLFDIVDDPATSSQKLNNDLSEIKDWARKWLVTINPSKTECMTFSAKRIKPPHPDLFYADNKIIEVAQHTHLGVVLCNNLSWRAHIFKIYEKASKRLNILKGIKYKVDRSTLRKLYKSLVRPLMEYADVLWDGCTDSESDLLEHVQYEAAKIVTGAMKGTSKQRLMQEIGWEDLKTRRAIHKLLLYFKIVNNLCPSYLVDLLPLLVSERTNYSLRTASNYSIFASRTERYKRSFFPSTTSLWNDIGYDIRCLDSIGSFKKALLSSYNVSNYNATFDFAIDRLNAIFHTRLRLDTCALNYYLFKIGCKESPACFCGFYNESVKHFFLECPLYSAPRTNLLSSAARIFADRWSSMSKAQIVSVFLFGSKLLSPKQNSDLFFYVQSFISDSKRFYKRT